MKRYKGIPAWILILLLLLPGTVFAEERAKITVESLDRGMELYILEAGETTLKSVGKDVVLTFENIGDRIYFAAVEDGNVAFDTVEHAYQNSGFVYDYNMSFADAFPSSPT